MNKIFFIIIIISLIQFFPINVLGEIDNLWMMNETITTNEETQTEIDLKEIKLNWSANTYVPFEYKGRRLPSTNSMVTVDVYLKISGGNKSNLKYSWFLDGFFQETKSGYNMDSFKFGIRRAQGDYHDVLVKIFNEDRSFSIERSIKIPIAKSEIIILPLNNEFSPLFQEEKMISVFSGEDLLLVAKPYFFDIKNLTDLSFKWQVFGQESIISSGYNASILKLTIPPKKDTKLLEKELEVTVLNNINFRQGASKKIKLQIY